MREIRLRESGSETIQSDHADIIFNSPGLAVEGWKLARPARVYGDKRVLRERKYGRRRLTTKVPNDICQIRN